MIPLKTAAEIAILREGGRRTGEILRELGGSLRAGMTTAEIGARTEALAEKAGITCAWRGYNGYPGVICVSVNEEVVHGIPGKRVLGPGDIVSLDFGALYRGFYTDSTITVAVGEASEEAGRLMEVTRRSLELGIAAALPGNRVGDISHAVQAHVEGQGFSVVKAFVGHGIGRRIHEDPQIPNFGDPGEGPLLKPGMVLAIEPMVNAGVDGVRVLADGWTAVTADGRISAHFEHTLAVTERGPVVLTADGE